MEVMEPQDLVRSYPVQLSHTLGAWLTFSSRVQKTVGPQPLASCCLRVSCWKGSLETLVAWISDIEKPTESRVGKSHFLP